MMQACFSEPLPTIFTVLHHTPLVSQSFLDQVKGFPKLVEYFGNRLAHVGSGDVTSLLPAAPCHM